MSTATPTISLCNQKNRITTELPNGNENFEEDDTIMTKEFICSRAVTYRRIFIKSVFKLIKQKNIYLSFSVSSFLSKVHPFWNMILLQNHQEVVHRYLRAWYYQVCPRVKHFEETLFHESYWKNLSLKLPYLDWMSS